MTHAAKSDPFTVMATAPRLPLVAAYLVKFACVVTTWDARARSRRALAQLSDQQLEDIGISRGRASTEAARPFWLF